MSAGHAKAALSTPLEPASPEPRADLASLPEPKKVVSFDVVAERVASMHAALSTATPEQAKALVTLVVESVETNDREVCRITIVPAARPFFRDDDC